VYEEGTNGALGHYRVRITCPDRSRPWFDLPPERKTSAAEPRAREKGKAYTERARREGIGVAPRRGTAKATDGEETVRDWCTRWFQLRRLRNFSSVGKDESRVRKHVLPTIGHLFMTDVRRDDLEDVVELLDELVLTGALGWKSAVNIWALVTKMLDDAQRSKVRALRVLTENPASGVPGPDRGNKKAKAYLYPAELVKLVSCAQVPLFWRRMYVLASYLFVRAAELDVLEWEDFDMTTSPPTVRVHRAWDEERQQRERPAGSHPPLP
jgi:hypothetical protein